MLKQVVLRSIAVGAYFIGIAGAVLFFAYVLGIGTGFWPRGESADGTSWVSNLSWLLAFAVQHSGMARQSFKRWWTRWILPALERSIYVAASGATLVGLTICWQTLPGEPLWSLPIGVVAVSLVAALGTGLCCWRFDHREFFGLQQAWTGEPESPASLCTTGPYRYVRHPLMLGLLLALWGQPIMPPELLMLNAGFTVYILIGIRLEERDLVQCFGEAYLVYRRRVPALLPKVWKT